MVFAGILRLTAAMQGLRRLAFPGTFTRSRASV
jgi:hypothetical protein